MQKDSRIYLAGHSGMVGAAVFRHLTASGYTNIYTAPHGYPNLRSQDDVTRLFAAIQPEYVFLCAAKVGGIIANSTYPAEFIYQNLQIQTNIINACRPELGPLGVKRLLFLGSSCIYPRAASQPIRESDLMTGPLEPTNEPYAMAKLAGISMCRAYRKQYGMDSVCLMPTNLFGPRDRSDHLVPDLMRKMTAAKKAGATEVILLGTGTPKRELMHVDDLARACVYFMNGPDVRDIVNIGTGHDMSVSDIAAEVADVVGYQGKIRWDHDAPDGTPRKVLDVSRAYALGWYHTIGLREGLERTYREAYPTDAARSY